MVTKRNKKHKVFSKNLTKRQKYSGGLGPEETGDSSSESPNIQIPSFVDETQYNKALASNTDTLIEQSLAMNENFYIIEKIKEKILELSKSQTTTTPGISGVSSEERKKQAELANQRAEENIAKGLINPQRKTGVKYGKDVFTYSTGDSSNMIYNTPSSQRIPIKGGGSYYSFYESTDTGKEKWKKSFIKFKEFQALFSFAGVFNTKRTDSIKRFFLYLEMMEFYNHVKHEITILNQIPGLGGAITYISEIYNSLDEADKTKIADTEISRKIVDIIIPTNEYQSGEYFVKFILFNTSISNLFMKTDQRLIALNAQTYKRSREYTNKSIDEQKLLDSKLEEDEKKYRTAYVNIFQISEKKTKTFKELNTDLTDVIPLVDIGVKAKMDSTDFYTQFKTFPLDLDYFNKTFFKKTSQTGDNVSALVRSTILYVISQLLNNATLLNALDSSLERTADITNVAGSLSIGKSLSKEWEENESINKKFLLNIITKFLYIGCDKKLSQLGNNIETLKHFLIASSKDVYKDNYEATIDDRKSLPDFGCAIPYNIFLNFFKREKDTIYLTTIPDNIITDSGLDFVNELETILTNNTYLNKITRDNINDEIAVRNYENTINTFNSKNDTSSSELPIIGLSAIKNNTLITRKNANGEDETVTLALDEQITDFQDFTEKLKLVKTETPREGGITANMKKEIKKIHTNHFDFKKNLSDSQSTFDSSTGRNIPDNCKVQTHITDLGGYDNATIDCQRACLMSQLVYENTKVVRQFDFKNCWGHDEILRNETINNKPITRGLKYLCAYQPNYQYGSYTNDMMSKTSSIDRFNNFPYKVKGSDNKYLVNYNYVDHKCHVWIDDYLKRVYIVFRGTASGYDWFYTDIGIASGLGFQEGRLQQIKEILRDVYRQLNFYASTYEEGDEEDAEGADKKNRIDSRGDYKVIFSGHSLGGFLAIMSSVAVYNNNKFDYKDTFKKATSITFNPWFPPEASFRGEGVGLGGIIGSLGIGLGGLGLLGALNPIFGLGVAAVGGVVAGGSALANVNQKQGFLNYYAPLIKYGNTCAFVFGVCGDAAQRTIIPACSPNQSTWQSLGLSICAPLKSTNAPGAVSYLNAIKGPFYYYLTQSWSSNIVASDGMDRLTNNHSVSNFYGIRIHNVLLKFITEYPTLYNDDPSKINNKYAYINELLDKLTKDIIEIGLNIRTNIVLSANYSVPSSANVDVRSLTLDVDTANLKATAIVDPNTIVPFEDMPQEDEYGDIPGQPSRPWGSKGGKYKTLVKRTSKKLRKRRSKRTTKKLRR